MTTLTAATSQHPMGLPTGTMSRPVPAPASAPGGVGMTGAEVLRIVRQRLVMIIFLTLFFAGLTVGVTYLMIRYYPQYKGTALVLVQSISPRDVMEPIKPQEVREEEVARLLQDQALFVKSPEVLGAALQDPEVRDTVWYREAEQEQAKKGEDPVDLLGDILTAEPVRDSNYVGVSVTWKVAEEVPKLVNSIVAKYVEIVDRQQKQSIREAEEQIGAEVGRAKGFLDQKTADIEKFRAEFNVLGVAQRETEERILTLTALVTELQVDMFGKKAIYDALANATPDSLPITAELQNLINSDPFIYQLEQRLQTAEEELNAAKSRFGENHRVVKGAQVARDVSADRVQEERARKIVEYQRNQIDQAKQSFLEAQEQLVTLKDSLIEARAEQQDKDAKQAKYLRLEDELEQYKTQYEQLQEKKHLLEVTLRQKKSVQIEARSWAKEPKRRSSPKWEIWVPIGSFLGLAVSIGFALLLEMADKSVRTPRDVLRHSIPVLGTIPSTEDDEIEIPRVETASLDAPHSVVAESFRNLRANLFFSAPAEQQGVILVTSPSGGNGKTTVATNLAISIALSGRRVLLIDANFRRACLPRIFAGMRDEGLSNVLIGQAHLDDVVTTTSVPGLDVLSAGPVPPNPAELLGSTLLRDLIVEARARYDQVIFDGPPVLLVSDAMVLAGSVDGVLLVCQYRETSRGALQRTQSQLEAMNSRIFGAVLNKVESRAGGYFRKAYREFYAYSEPSEESRGETPQLKSDVEGGQLRADDAGAAPAAGSTEAGDIDSTARAELGADLLPSVDDISPAMDEPLPTVETISPGTGSDWGTIDLDQEIDAISGEKLLTEDDLKLDDSTPPEEPGLADESGDAERPR
ncbi:MAG TPA: polysaccharide biosynthesis tyrosine autokinase [Phycisphaerae bacterium]|nr:polysaccharide biosynthesis tyrosine autokinase [Phycisphaerae bacterium]